MRRVFFSKPAWTYVWGSLEMGNMVRCDMRFLEFMEQSPNPSFKSESYSGQSTFWQNLGYSMRRRKAAKRQRGYTWPAWWFRSRLLFLLSLLVLACALWVLWVFCVWCVARLVELLCLFSLLRLLVLAVWWVFYVSKSGKSAFYGEFAVPVLLCESGVSAVPGRVVVSPTVCFFMH